MFMLTHTHTHVARGLVTLIVPLSKAAREETSTITRVQGFDPREVTSQDVHVFSRDYIMGWIEYLVSQGGCGVNVGERNERTVVKLRRRGGG
jgi:hypothetical protein